MILLYIYFINQICRYRGRAYHYCFSASRRRNIFYYLNLPLPGWALLSFVLRKRVTRESNLRGVIATRSSPLKNPLSFLRRAHKCALRRGCGFKMMLPAALCAQGRVPQYHGGFKGDLLAFPLDRFLGIVLLRLKRMIRPAAAAANIKNINNEASA